MTSQQDSRNELIITLIGMRAMHANDVRMYIDLADRRAGDRDCGCDAEDECTCMDWDRNSALSAAHTCALLALAAATEMQALVAWWTTPPASDTHA
jgi:hypothetical protein